MDNHKTTPAGTAIVSHYADMVRRSSPACTTACDTLRASFRPLPQVGSQGRDERRLLKGNVT